jgi:hypothetical protein
LVVPARPNRFAGHEVLGWNLDVADQQLLHDILAVDRDIQSGGNGVRPDNIIRRVKRTGQHNDFDRKRRRFRRFERADQYEYVNGQSGECRKLKRPGGHNSVDRHSGSPGQLERPNRYDDLNWNAGRFKWIDGADDNRNDLSDNGG